jgi:hypothetical protein
MFPDSTIFHIKNLKEKLQNLFLFGRACFRALFPTSKSNELSCSKEMHVLWMIVSNLYSWRSFTEDLDKAWCTSVKAVRRETIPFRSSSWEHLWLRWAWRKCLKFAVRAYKHLREHIKTYASNIIVALSADTKCFDHLESFTFCRYGSTLYGDIW